MEYINFFKQVQKLKDVKRTGWLYKDIENPESVADHSWGVTLLALTIKLPQGVKREKLVHMAIIHDIAECLVGDIVWEKGKTSNLEKQKSKHQQETKHMRELFGSINKIELRELSLDFLNQKSKTAKFLKELDKLEMVFQALEYEKNVNPSQLDEFWENADKYITSKQANEIFKEIKNHRKLS